MADMTLSGVLQKGIQREIESQRLYSELGKKVRDPAAKYAFEVLVKEEYHHQQILEQYLAGGLKEEALDIRQTVDYHIAERFQQPEIEANTALPDIFLFAAKREKEASEFYLDLASLHPPGKTRKLLEKMASEELGHKNRVESLYTEVAFAQTDGG